VHNKLPIRKHPRLKKYDYSQNGYYHIIICTLNKQPILSKVVVGRGLAPAEIELSPIGVIVEEQLLKLSERYPYVNIDKYVIMPTHIHAIITLVITNINDAAGASPRPTVMDIVCAFKSISTRLCNKYDNVQGRQIWQESFYDEVIQTSEAYNNIWQYIDNNPAKWVEDRYYVE